MRKGKQIDVERPSQARMASPFEVQHQDQGNCLGIISRSELSTFGMGHFNSI
jgi:hypothetical protein